MSIENIQALGMMFYNIEPTLYGALAVKFPPKLPPLRLLKFSKVPTCRHKVEKVTDTM